MEGGDQEENINGVLKKKGPWSSEEDQKLMDCIRKNGQGNWQTIPKQAGLNRCGKSCRLRWTNYLKPGIKRGGFSEEEEAAIIALHKLLGNKWSRIAAQLPRRTDNEIKNYWNTHLKKKLLNMGIDPKTHRPIPPPDQPNTIHIIDNLLSMAQLLRSSINPYNTYINSNNSNNIPSPPPHVFPSDHNNIAAALGFGFHQQANANEYLINNNIQILQKALQLIVKNPSPLPYVQENAHVGDLVQCDRFCNNNIGTTINNHFTTAHDPLHELPLSSMIMSNSFTCIQSTETIPEGPIVNDNVNTYYNNNNSEYYYPLLPSLVSVAPDQSSPAVVNQLESLQQSCITADPPQTNVFDASWENVVVDDDDANSSFWKNILG